MSGPAAPILSRSDVTLDPMGGIHGEVRAETRGIDATRRVESIGEGISFGGDLIMISTLPGSVTSLSRSPVTLWVVAHPQTDPVWERDSLSRCHNLRLHGASSASYLYYGDLLRSLRLGHCHHPITVPSLVRLVGKTSNYVMR